MLPTFRTLRLVPLAALLWAACGATAAVKPAPVTVWLDPYTNPEGPFPSDDLTISDLSTQTGLRVDLTRLTEDKLPIRGLAFFDGSTPGSRQRDVQTLDGFSGFAPVFIPFSGPLDPGTVVPAAFAIVDMATGETVPVDPHYEGGNGTWVTLHPARVMRSAHRQVILITKSLHALDGNALRPAQAFPVDATILEKALAASGLKRSQLLGAFRFTVQDTTGELEAIVNDSMGHPIPAVYDVVKTSAREIVGKFLAPDYRDAEVMPIRAPGTVPKVFKMNELQFYLKLPIDWATAPRPYPLAIWGHGLTGTRLSVPDVNLGAIIAIDAVEHGTRQTVAQSDLVAFKFIDVVHTLPTRDHFRQTSIDNLTLARVLTTIDSKLQASLGGPAWVDDSKIAYIGGSLGAIQGASVASLAPNIDTVVMVVGGAGLSLAFEYGLFHFAIPNAIIGHTVVERDMFFAMMQTLFDRADGVNYLRHMTREPIAPSKPRDFLFLEVVGDQLVPNWANETYMWAAGASLLAPVYQNFYHLPVFPGPTAGSNVTVNGITRTSIAYQYNPSWDDVPGLDRHGYLADHMGARRQIEHFFIGALKDGHGEVIQGY